MSMLRVEEVRAGYGTGPDILTELTLSIEQGGTYCIIGPNGAGKSTLLKTVAGILRPRQGRVLFEGSDIGGLRPDEILDSGVCFVPQDRTLFPQMTVRENLVMGGYLIRDRAVLDRRIKNVYEMFPRLAERSTQLSQTMSGGEQQMLAIARALMIQPRLMMIDEPSLGLAPQMADQIFATIRMLNEEMDVTVLLVEQNVKRGLELAEHAFVLDLGSMAFEGPSETILADPRIRDLYLGKLAAGSTEDT